MANTSFHNVPRKPVVLVILDGFGINPKSENNAIAQANTPNLDKIFSSWSHTLLQTSGADVGLPEGQMGNSEVGHMTLGSGSIIRQDLVRIDDAIKNGEFFSNKALNNAVASAKKNGRPLHLLGLVSDGGVHSHINHVLALIELCKQQQVIPVIHMITDGRDTAPKSALKYIELLEPALKSANGFIATVMGRFYAMDRDQRWERTELAWRALMLGATDKADSATEAVNNAYAKDLSDEFIKPTVLRGHTPLSAEDQIICFNFRKDRPRQIVAALSVADFIGFDRGDFPLPQMTCLMSYDKSFHLPFAFAPESPETTLGEIISSKGLRQFHCAETEKYAHVTYFFNGGRAEPYSGETQLLIPSPHVATYDMKPEMSAVEVANAVVTTMEAKQYAFIVVNFANGDMVGHTAIKDAVIKAIECLDVEVAKIFKAAEKNGYSVVLTADHGNCELQIDPETGEPHTQHTMFPVPCVIMDDEEWELAEKGGLANVAPTILQLMGISQPATMRSSSLLINSNGKRTASIDLYGAA